MTTYTGHITEAISSIQAETKAIAAEHGDLGKAPSFQLFGIREDVTTLCARIDEAKIEVEGQISAKTNAFAVGAHPLDAVKTLLELVDDHAQLEKLVEMRGYAGRVLLHLRAGGVQTA